MSDVKEVDSYSKIALFACIAVDEVLFKRALATLDNNLFPEQDNVFEFWFDTVKELYADVKEMPDIKMLQTAVAASLMESKDVSEEEVELINHIWQVANTYTKLPEDKKTKYCSAAYRTLSNYISDCTRKNLARQLSRPQDLLTTIESARNSLVEKLATDEDVFGSLFLEKLDQRKPGKILSLGLEFVDAFAAGSPGTREVMGHAAPRGGGKSTLINQCACNVAMEEQVKAAKENRAPAWVYIFNYERPEDPLCHSISYVGTINRNQVEHSIITGQRDHFTKAPDYADYEVAKFGELIKNAKKGKGLYPLAEYDRFNAARNRLASNLCIADFSGQTHALMRYAGNFVEGMAEFIEQHQQRNGNPGVLFVGVDYAGVCARVHMRATNRKEDAERSLIEEIPLRAKRLVANRFNCFVWVTHQLAADEAGRKGGTRPDPNKFKMCKSFPENCDFCIVNGVISKEDSLAVFVQAKARRGIPRPDMVGHLEADFCKWTSAGANYVIYNNQVVPADLARKMHIDEAF
jgi:hypothetical protein